MTENNNPTGIVAQVMGPVVDVSFKEASIPEIYTALKLSNPAISDERIKSMLFWAAFVFFCIVDIRRLNNIFIWSRDDG